MPCPANAVTISARVSGPCFVMGQAAASAAHLALAGNSALADIPVEALQGLLEKNGAYLSMAALNAIDRLGDRAAAARDAIGALPKSAPGVIPTMRENVPNLLQHVDANFH